MTRGFRLRAALLGTAATIVLLPVATHAATAEGADSHQVSEVVVTAQKREQRIQDVPMAVSAVTATEIQARGVNNLEDLQFTIPGLSAFQYGPGQEFIQLRGISSATSGPQTSGQYLDEVPINGDSVASTMDVRMVDMERVEVLRGPQGTLYGEGSMGGTIRYITASPSLTAFSASVEGEVGSVADGGASYKANAVISMPLLQDKVGLRLVAEYERDGGWIDNAVTGQSDVNGATVKLLRGKLLVRPNDRAQFSLMALHEEVGMNEQNFGLHGVSTNGVPFYHFDRQDVVNGVFTYNFGSVKLLESAGYINRTTDAQFDLTPFYLPFLEGVFGIPHGFITKIPYPNVSTQKIYTNELRLSSQHAGGFNWTVGAYYRNSEGAGSGGVSTSPGTLPFTILSSTSVRKSESWAAFGEANYQFNEHLNVLLGLRYFQDHVTQVSDSVSFGFPSHDVGDAKFSSLNPRLNVSYAFSRTSMVYFNAAKGFRSGGFNYTSAGGGVVTIPPTYAPDKLWTYEVGAKQQLMDRKLEIQGSVYYNDWKDIQSTFFAPGSAITVVRNGGKATGWGVDLTAAAHPVEGLTLSATYGWNNMAYKIATADHLPGDPVDGAVRESYSASLEYRRPVFGETEGFFRTDYQHAGEAQLTLRNFGGQIIPMPAKDLVNFRVGLNFGRVEASLFANNAFNDDSPIIVGPFGVITTNVEQRPRTVGVNVKARF